MSPQAQSSIFLHVEFPLLLIVILLVVWLLYRRPPGP
jgi:hypothetical protein